MRAGLLAVVVVGAALALVPGPASASCAVPRPAAQLAYADGAFVGRLVQELPDRWVFAVDEAVKGEFGARVEVLRGPITSVSLAPEIGRQIGLFLDGSAAAGWTSSECAVVTPAQLHAAAAAPRLQCRMPVIRSVRFRTRGRLDVALGALDDPSTTVTVHWGDGTVSTRRFGRGPSRRTLVMRHGYQEPGRHRVKVTVTARPVEACGSFAERAFASPMVVQVSRT
jgi:hypothetical protein